MQELYQELIVDHGRHPRNFGPLATATHIKEGFNPLCGDKVKLYITEKITEKGAVIDDARFEGCGCAISMASASLMTQYIKNKTISEVNVLFHDFHDVVRGKSQHLDRLDKLGKLAAFAGVADYPARVKCATLCWHTMCAMFVELTDLIEEV